ncbi:MAG TPA: hypothetical protein VK509_22215 [Polyangiales bacterium]|nr:hypothetical protein [Polyangiales bacterium]
MPKPLLNICRYKVKPGKEAEMEKLLALHWPALHAAGLVTEEPARVYRGLPSGKPGDEHGATGVYVEIMVWKDQRSPQLAHQTPAVMAVWEPMGAICEDMDFPAFEPLDLSIKNA